MNTNLLTRQSWQRVRNIVAHRDGETCQYCGDDAPDGEADHILPLEKGGRDAFDNLVWACQGCNTKKQGKTLREWIITIRSQYSDPIPRPPEQRGKMQLAKLWLRGVFSKNDITTVKLLDIHGGERGFSPELLTRAKSQLIAEGFNIVSERQSDGWAWRLVP